MSSPLNTIHLNAIFTNLDTNGDGLLSLDEITWLLEKLGVHTNRVELELLVGKDTLDPLDFLFFYQTLTTIKGTSDIDAVGGNHYGIIEEAEEEENGLILVDRDLEGAFKVFDLNDDGFISCEELQIALSKLGLWDDQCCGSAMIRVYDVNEDGFLDFEEFKTMMSS